jgi:hypothetical protein
MICKTAINRIASPNRVYSHCITWKYSGIRILANDPWLLNTFLIRERAEECLCRARVTSNTDLWLSVDVLLHVNPILEHTLSNSYDIFNIPFIVHRKINTDTLICIFVYSVCILSASCHCKYHHATVTNADIMLVYCKINFNCTLNYCIYISFFRTRVLSILCIVL